MNRAFDAEERKAHTEISRARDNDNAEEDFERLIPARLHRWPHLRRVSFLARTRAYTLALVITHACPRRIRHAVRQRISMRLVNHPKLPINAIRASSLSDLIIKSDRKIFCRFGFFFLFIRR